MQVDVLENLLREARPELPKRNRSTRVAWEQVRARIERKSRFTLSIRWSLAPALATAACAAWLLTAAPDERLSSKSAETETTSVREGEAPAEPQRWRGISDPVPENEPFSERRQRRGNSAPGPSGLRPVGTPRDHGRSENSADHSALTAHQSPITTPRSPHYVRTVTYHSGYVRETLQEGEQQIVITKALPQTRASYLSGIYRQPEMPAEKDEPEAETMLERATVIQSGDSLNTTISHKDIDGTEAE